MRNGIILFIYALLSFTKQLSAQSIVWMDSVSYSIQNISRGVAADASGVFTAGTFGSYHPGPPFGSFLHKYDPNGNLLWADTCKSGFNNITALGVDVDKLGNSYTAIWVGSSPVWINGISYPGSSSSYIIKYNSAGQVQWVRNHSMAASDVAVDNYGYIYLSGLYSSSSGFTAKYDSNGNFISEWPAYGYMAFDKFNNLYLTSGSAVAKFDPSGNQLWSYPSVNGIISTIDSLGFCYISTPGASGISDVIKLSPYGLQMWDLTVNYEGAGAIHADNNGNVWVAGVNCGPSSTFTVEIHKYSTSSGGETWVYQLPNSNDLRPNGLITRGNDLYISSNIIQNAYTYLMKIGTPFTTSIKEESNSSALSVYPNPSSTSFSIHYKNASGGNFTLNIKDAAGKCIRTIPQSDFTGELNETIDLSGFAKGVYFVEISGASIRKTKKLVLE